MEVFNKPELTENNEKPENAENSDTESEDEQDSKANNDIDVKREDVQTSPIVGVFLTKKKYRTPHTFEMYLQRTGSIPEVVIFLNVKLKHAPVVSDQDRFHVFPVVPNKVFYLTVNVGFSESLGPMVLPAFITAGSGYGLPDHVELDKITLFVEADKVRIVSTFIPLKIVLSAYMILKSLFFGSSTIKFPEDRTVYLSSIASL